ncbi:MAG: lysine-2,3-aminomutase-like protein [Lentisphaeraceae bacterium]|nr:lysine-2,3-aminomutase-like protein [Lentisphaeraceae bacterium]
MSTKNNIKNCQSLLDKDLITSEELTGLEKVAQKFSVSISKSVLENTSSPDVLKQYVPAIEELDVKEDELDDPIGDSIHSPVKGIVHRYPDRVLFKPLHVCEVYCRFCFRRENVGRGKEILSNEEIDSAIQYIEKTPEIFEVIFSGGDPFVLAPEKLAKLVKRISDIEHVQVIRFHTRLPIVSPEKVSAGLLEALESEKAVFIVVHCNSHEEIHDGVSLALKKLQKEGIPILSQSVLLKGVNDCSEKLEQLFRTLVKNRVKPYYLHHLDKAEGTSHFRVDLTSGQELMKELRGKVSGLCQANYVIDVPGGFGKVPVGHNYVSQDGKEFFIEDWQGCQHKYFD